MIAFKKHTALQAADFEKQGGQWDPHTHWIVPTTESIEAAFVQGLLDKYAEHVEAFSILPVFDGSTYCVELQFRDPDVGEQCSTEYLKAFRKGGTVTRQKKSRASKPKRRLPKRRMYRLPDGVLLWYFGVWDGHGNVIGKVLEPVSGLLENKVVHRSLLEDGELIAKGEEPWLPETAD